MSRKNKRPKQSEIDDLSANHDQKNKHELDLQQKELKRKLRELRKTDEEKTKQLIFYKTEAETENILLERNKVTIEFNDGRKSSIADIKKISEMLLAEAKSYDVTFPSELYDQMRRLTGLKKDENNPHHKPSIFAIYTIKYIYGRFNLKEFIRALQQRNPFLPGLNVRNFKHFQYLNEEDHSRLKGFIADAIRIMKTCKDNEWYKFESIYAKMYQLAFPDDLFDVS